MSALKNTFLIALSLLCIKNTHASERAEKNTYKNNAKKNKTEEVQQTQTSKSTPDNKHQPMKIPPTTNLSTKGNIGIDFAIDFLYWKPSEGNFDYAVLFQEAPLGSNLLPLEIHTLCFEHKPGVRIKAGYHIPNDSWETTFIYTHLNAEASSDTRISTPFLYPSQVLPSFNINAQTAEANWNLDFNQYDFLFQHEQTVCQSFLWIPSFGIRGSTIHQHWNFSYDGIYPASFPDPTAAHATNQTKNNFNGIGPLAGIDMGWHWGCGFRALANISCALLWGSCHIQQDQIMENIEEPGFSHVKNNLSLLSPNLQMRLALAWGKYFCHKKVYFDLHAGYEAQVFWNQNKAPIFMSDNALTFQRSSEQLSLEGLVLGAHLEF